MASVLNLLDLFEADFGNCVRLERELTFHSKSGPVPFRRSICYEDQSGSKFVAVWFPAHAELLVACTLLLQKFDIVFELEEGVKMASHRPTDAKPTSYTDFKFTGRVYYYLETDLAAEIRENLEAIAKQCGMQLFIRDMDYARKESASRKPLAFLSHDSREKDVIARPLATELIKARCAVWYDDFSLRLGDSLRASIESGLKECKKCVLILTPNFLSNAGWTLKEFDSIFTREMVMKEKVLLPIWSGVTAKEVYEFSPSLANIKAHRWDGNAKDTADHIKSAILRAEKS